MIGSVKRVSTFLSGEGLTASGCQSYNEPFILVGVVVPAVGADLPASADSGLGARWLVGSLVSMVGLSWVLSR